MFTLPPRTLLLFLTTESNVTFLLCGGDAAEGYRLVVGGVGGYGEVIECM